MSLTPERIAHIDKQIRRAHQIGGPTYADCRAILGRACPGPVPYRSRPHLPKGPSPIKARRIKARRMERATWWRIHGLHL